MTKELNQIHQRETIVLLHTRDDSEEHLFSYIHDAILHYFEDHGLDNHLDDVRPLAEEVWEEVKSREVAPDDRPSELIQIDVDDAGNPIWGSVS